MMTPAALLILLSLFVSPATGDEALIRTGLLRARIFVETGDLPRAQETLEGLLEIDPEDRSVAVDLASVYSRRGDIERAEGLYRSLIRRFPRVDAYWTDLAYLLSDAGRDEDLIALLAPRADALVAQSAPVATLLAEAYYRQDRVDLAESIYGQLLKGQKSDVPTLLLIGEGYLRQGQHPRALSYFDRVLALDPNSFRALRGTGLAMFESHPEKARRALERAVEVERIDVDAPYFLAELIYPTDAEAARIYYMEALRRLEKVTAPTLYQRSIEARMLARTGRFEAARAIYSSLLARGTDDVRYDFAELLIEREEYDEALDVLSSSPDEVSDAGTQRAALLRVRIHFERRRWGDAVAPLLALNAYRPEDRGLRVDLADGLHRAGHWAEALDVLDSLVVRDTCDAYSERAYEMRREIRTDRGNAIGFTLDHTGLTDGGTYPFRLFARAYVHPGLGFTVDAVDGLYRDDSNFNQEDFKGWTGEIGVALHLGSRRDRDLTLRARRHLFRSDDQIALGARGRLDIAGGQVTFDVDRRSLWTGPVDAVLFDGLLDRLAVEGYLPLPGRLALSGFARFRQFWIFQNEDFGTDRQAGGNLGWTVIQRAYGSRSWLRSMTASIGYDASSSEQDPAYEPLIDLIDRSRTITANLSIHALIACRSTLDLWAFTGRDSERDLGFGKLYGLGGRFHRDVTDRLAFNLTGLMVSESALDQQAGVYREASVALVYHFSPWDRSRHDPDAGGIKERMRSVR